MIEVEKKFQPTKEQLDAMLADADFLGEVVNRDVLYDYADYRLFKKHIRFRNRNGNFELKVPTGISGDTELAVTEFEDEEEIKKYFNITKNLKDFVGEELILLMDITTYRKKYKRGEFNIDVDSVKGVYDFCEIEIMVEKEEDVAQAREKILNFALQYNFEVKNLPTKRELFLKKFRPDLYTELYTKNI
jgi:adenylate cyclase class IV